MDICIRNIKSVNIIKKGKSTLDSDKSFQENEVSPDKYIFLYLSTHF